MQNRLRRFWYSTLQGDTNPVNMEYLMPLGLARLRDRLTKYCNIKGPAIAGSIFPTITTVKVEGSLKQLLKY